MELMYPLKLRMEKFINIGYDILCLESKSFRRKMCFYLKSNDIDKCLKLSGEFWNNENEKMKKEIIENVKYELGIKEKEIVTESQQELLYRVP